jgi:tetratricopeptide (TPR) repeat protein
MRPGTVHPPHLIEHLEALRIHPAELEPEMLLPFIPRAAEIDQHKDFRLAGVAKILAETASIHAAATALIQLEPWDFMGVYFDGIDHFCHGYMKYHPPRLEWIPEADFELYKEVVNAGYQFHDMMLGTYLELIDEHTTVVIVSDHGFHPDHLRPKEIPNEPAGPADEHREFGVVAMMGPGIKQNEHIFGASLLDITPTILSLFGLPIGDDMDGKPLVGAFREAPAITSVPSWDGIEGDAGLHPAGTQSDPVDQHQALQQLVELGYIDKPDENIEKAAANTVMELRYNLARDLLDSNHLPEAIALFEELWQTNPDEGRFGVHLFNAQLKLGRSDAAQLALERLIQEKQRTASQAAEQIKALQEQWQQAEKKPEDLSQLERQQLNKLRRRAGVNPHTFAFLRGRLLATQGEHEQALVHFEQARAVQVHNRPSLYEQIAASQLALGRLDEAEREYNAIRAIDPINTASRLGLARVYTRRKQPKRALDYATAAASLVHHLPQAHYLCGRSLAAMGRTTEAITSLELALAQNPVYPHAHQLLAKLHKRLNRLELSREHRLLARASMARIKAFRRGEPLPEDTDLDADLDALLSQPASVAHLSCSEALPPLVPGEVVVVSGLPRSGTSMLMQMLEAGGLELLSDGKRSADASNQRGYQEFEPVKSMGRTPASIWIEQAAGKAVKIVAPLLPHLPPGRPYRILFLERPLQQVLASQTAMLSQSGQQRSRRSERQLAAAFLQQVNNVGGVLQRHSETVQVLSLDYNGAIEAPARAAAQVNRFLGGHLNESAMAQAVAPDLRRQGRNGASAGSGGD